MQNWYQRKQSYQRYKVWRSKVYGDVNEFAKKYYQDGPDEIIFIDTVASLYGRNKLDEVITIKKIYLFQFV